QEAKAVAVDRIRLSLAVRDPVVLAQAARTLVVSGVDPRTLPVFARRPVKEAESRLTPAERARLARLLVTSDPARAVRLAGPRDAPRWPAAERAETLLALAKAHARLGDTVVAARVASAIPDDGSAAVYEGRLLRADLELARAPKSASNGRTALAGSTAARRS